MSTTTTPGLTAAEVAALRADFPILHTRIHGKPLVYLDNAASSQMPRVVIQRMVRYQEQEHANVHRGVHTLSQNATTAYEAARDTIRQFIHARSLKEVIFTRGATESINLVAHAWGRAHLVAGDEIVISTLEHHANIVPWQLLCEDVGAVLRVIPMSDAGVLDQAAYQALLGPRTRLVAVTQVSNALGTINPVADMIRQAQAVGAVTLIDGAQAAPHLAVDVQALGCDFYAFSGHKMCGPTGIGILYGKEAVLDTMRPWMGGGDMIRTVSFEQTTYNELPYKFEAGTPAIAAAIGLAAAIDYLHSVGLARIAAHEHALLARATELLNALPGVTLLGTAPDKASVLSFALEGIHPHDIGTILDGEGIAVRAGHHCAQPLMARLGVPATARASFAFYNTFEEVDALAAGIRTVQEILGMSLQLLYNELIKEHNKKPRNYVELPDADRKTEGFNPLCGDHIWLYLKLDSSTSAPRVEGIGFQGASCAICQASASIMTTLVKGQSVADADALVTQFRKVVTGEASDLPADSKAGKYLAAFAGISGLPSRVKCAVLPWHTLHAALTQQAVATTEGSADPVPGSGLAHPTSP